MTPRGFIIHFTARSGSTFVIFTLMQHPQIKARAEVFGASKLPGNLEQSDQNQIAFLRRFMRPYRLETPGYDGISRGFKIQIARESQQIRNVNRYVKVANQYDLAKFFLYRTNRVKQVISAFRARQVKALTKEMNSIERAHVFDAETHQKVGKLPKISVTPEHLIRALEKLDDSYKGLESLKIKMGGGIDLFYEDSITERQQFFDGIFREIGVHTIDVTRTDETKKITSENLVDVIENFDEVHTRLRGTRYEAQLMGN